MRSASSWLGRGNGGLGRKGGASVAAAVRAEPHKAITFPQFAGKRGTARPS